MLVNTDTLCSLQIFETEDHANIHSLIKKEGLSLFSEFLVLVRAEPRGLTRCFSADMLNKTKTGLGKALLKRWMLQPSTEAEVLNERLNAVECLSRSENSTCPF